MKKILFSAILALSIVPVLASAATVVVSGNTSSGENQPGWMFNRDTTTQTPFLFNRDQASVGIGSLFIPPITNTVVGNGDKFIAEDFLLQPIADVRSISYDFMIHSTRTTADAGQFYMNVYANFGTSSPTKFFDCRYDVVPTTGSTTGFVTVTFDPTQAYPVTQRVSSPHPCPAIPADMDAFNEGSSTLRVFAINVGDTSSSDTGVSGYLDNVVVATNVGTTTYDFDPIQTLSAQDFGVMDFSGVKGYSAGFNLINATLSDIASATVQLYSGTTLLQANTASTSLTSFGGTQFSSPFDVLGSFDYIADGVWLNHRESEFGKTLVPTRVVATVTLTNDKVVTAENTNLTGMPFSLSSIEITHPANKLAYFTSEPLDLAGLVVTGTYNDASTSTLAVTNADVSGFDSSSPVTGQVLTITIGGKVATYTIDVNPAPVITSGGGGFIFLPPSNSGPSSNSAPSSNAGPSSSQPNITPIPVPQVSDTSGQGRVLGASISAFVRDMKSGARGDDVIELQNRLIAEGHLKIKAATGYFGPLTKAALIKWQLKHKLPGTGYFGQLSRRALLNNQ